MIFVIFFSELLVFSELKSKWVIPSRKTSDLLIRSFIMSNLSELLMVALLSWATRVIRSQALICPERSKRIALSGSLKWLILSKWANEQMSDEQMSEFPTLHLAIAVASQLNLL